MRKQIVLITLTLFFSHIGHTQFDGRDSSQTSSGIDMNNNYFQRGFAAYLGAGAGYTASNLNSDVESGSTSIKLLGSYVIDSTKAVFDAGYGIQNQNFSQSEAIDSSISAGAMELAARYQFDNRWQLGVIYNQIFDRGENYGSEQADAEFGGAQILREFSFGGDFLSRVGGRIMTSINVNSESINMAVIDFQIGWGGTNSRFSSMTSN